MGHLVTTRTSPQEPRIELRKSGSRSGPRGKSPETEYEVILDGVVVGTVAKRYRESWRQLPSGVRYGMRGHTVQWDTSAVGWQPYVLDGAGSVSFHRMYDGRTRKDAVDYVVRRWWEAVAAAVAVGL